MSGPTSVYLPIIASLVLAVILLAIRLLVMQRMQTQRQRENRQETERLKSLVAAYRAMAGSFSPAEPGDRDQLEGGLSDIILFGSVRQVELASACAVALSRGEPVDFQPLIDDLRTSLRKQLGLDPIPASLALPPAGPSPMRFPPAGEGGRRGGGGGVGGSGGGASDSAGLSVTAGAGIGLGAARPDDS